MPCTLSEGKKSTLRKGEGGNYLLCLLLLFCSSAALLLVMIIKMSFKLFVLAFCLVFFCSYEYFTAVCCCCSLRNSPQNQAVFLFFCFVQQQQQQQHQQQQAAVLQLSLRYTWYLIRACPVGERCGCYLLYFRLCPCVINATTPKGNLGTISESFAPKPPQNHCGTAVVTNTPCSYPQKGFCLRRKRLRKQKILLLLLL